MTWGEQAYSDTNKLEEMADFYQRITHISELPKTLQAEPAKFIAAFEDIKEQGYEGVIAITIVGAISGTIQSLSMVAKEYLHDFPFAIIDSKGTSYQMERLLERTIQLQTLGYILEDIRVELECYIEAARFYFYLDDLSYLVRGGRLSSVSAFLAKQLHIKPILYFDELGKIAVYQKVLSRKNVYRTYLSLVEAAYAQFPQGFTRAIAHGSNYEEAQKLHALLDGQFPALPCRIGYLTPVLGSFTGPNALGMGILPNLNLSLD